MGLYNIGNHDMPCVFSVYSHVDNGPNGMTAHIRNPQTLHQLIISRSHFLTVNLGNNAIAADLLDIRYP